MNATRWEPVEDLEQDNQIDACAQELNRVADVEHELTIAKLLHLVIEILDVVIHEALDGTEKGKD